MVACAAHRCFGTLGLLLLGSCLSEPAEAWGQLRPLDPLDPWVWKGNSALSAEVGAGVFREQRASLAGTEGVLVEIGNFAVRWRTGRVVLEAGGTVQRLFGDEERFAAPAGGAELDPDGVRHDAGDYRVSTAVRITPADAPAHGVVRFGARLPTTDNRVGLDRDATDFFALIGGGSTRGRGWGWVEGGVGINGARSSTAEQSDVFAYAASAGWRGRLLTPILSLAGQAGGSGGRGNEALAELRAGMRLGGRRWVQASGVWGVTSFSPSVGVLLSAGWNR